MTEEQKINNHRRRLARRLFKQAPLITVLLMLDKYPDYSHEQLEMDLPLRSKRKKKTKFKKLMKHAEFER